MTLGVNIGRSLRKGDIVALQGTLAAGKTTLTKGIALGMGIQEDVTSPTFTLISQYQGALPLYHLDIYRLESYDECVDIGAEDAIYGDGVCVIEWSEKIMNELPKTVIIILLSALSDGSRSISIENWPYGELTC